MGLVPLLGKFCHLREEEVFTASLGIMVPVCLVSLLGSPLPWKEAAPYLAGSFAGGLLSGRVHIPTLWLHRILGLLILLGGGRMLWS